jgi:hypothetical protein
VKIKIEGAEQSDMDAYNVFVRQVKLRSNDHQRAMKLLTNANIPSQMVAILRQELDSMVRVIYLLSQEPKRRADLVMSAVRGVQWMNSNGKNRVTDREMVELSQKLQGWTRSVYKFGCAFIHLSNLHDYNDRDPLSQLPIGEREAILDHCRYYHGGPSGQCKFIDLIPYIPRVLDKISSNLECYLQQLNQGLSHQPDEI